MLQGKLVGKNSDMIEDDVEERVEKHRETLTNAEILCR